MPIHDWTRVRSGTYHNFHYRWIAAVMDRLNAGVLPPGFFAMAEQVIGGPEPDVVTLQLDPGDASRAASDSLGGDLALAEAPPQPQTTYVLPAEEADRYARKANRVVVKHQLGQVVAIIEIVSPGNKDSRHALRSFVTKLVDLLYEGINLLIVDPFPPGPLDPQGVHQAIWDQVSPQAFELPASRPLTLAAYQVSPVKTAYVEPVAVGDTLPDMPLFLYHDFYIQVPLEATYMETWNVLPGELRRLVE